jgi:hypothetical protein
MASLQMRVAGRSFRVARKFMRPLGEQLSAGRGEHHIGPGFMVRQPAFVDRSLDDGPKLLARAAGMSEIAI